MPLLLCFAAVYTTLPRAARWAFCALALAGIYPSFLGAMMRYGSLHEVQQFTRQNTLQAIQGDIRDVARPAVVLQQAEVLPFLDLDGVAAARSAAVPVIHLERRYGR